MFRLFERVNKLIEVNDNIFCFLSLRQSFVEFALRLRETFPIAAKRVGNVFELLATHRENVSAESREGQIILGKKWSNAQR